MRHEVRRLPKSCFNFRISREKANRSGGGLHDHSNSGRVPIGTRLTVVNRNLGILWQGFQDFYQL